MFAIISMGSSDRDIIVVIPVKRVSVGGCTQIHTLPIYLTYYQ